MTAEKTDRRVRRTRALLQQCLIRLMQEKELKDISVKELTDLADINRGTFYLHYTDIFDMLHKIEDEIFMEFNEILTRTLASEEQAASPKAVLWEIFIFLERNRDMAKVMIGSHGDLAFVNCLKNLVNEHLNHLWADHMKNFEYYDSFIVSGYVGVIEAWLNHPDPLPAEKMAELCCYMQNPAFTQSRPNP